MPIYLRLKYGIEWQTFGYLISHIEAYEYNLLLLSTRLRRAGEHDVNGLY